MNPDNNLKSPEELEEKDRAAQGAKLQELIRRGTPRDLAQAQELMKIMSGAEPENKPDYSKQTRKELDKVQSRAILLNDMLNNAKRGEKFAKGDAYDQIASHLRGVQPRIQKWISQAEEGSSDEMDRLLLINDLINQVCERYKAFTKGDFDATANIDPSIDPSRGGADAVPTAKISDLIDFGDPEPANGSGSGSGSGSASGTAAGSASLMDDFASLTFDNGATSPSTSSAAPAAAGLAADLFGSSDSPSGSNRGPASWGALQLPTSSTGAPPASTGSTGSGTVTPSLMDMPALTPASKSATASPKPQQQQPAAKSNDPFADLDAMFK